MNVLSTLIRFTPAVLSSFIIKDKIFISSKIKKQLDESKKAFLLKNIFPGILDNEEIRTDIYVKFSDHCLPLVCGTTFGPSPVILVNYPLHKYSELTSKFLCRQAVYHIKTNAGFLSVSLALLASTIAAFVLPYLGLTSWLYVASHLIPFYVATKVVKLVSSFYSNKTFLLAVNKAENDELICMKSYLATQQNEFKKWKHFVIFKKNAELNAEWLTLIETEIKKRKIDEKEEDSDNIKKLEELHHHCFENRLRLLKDSGRLNVIKLLSFI